MIADTGREAADQQLRWDRWQTRNDRSSRRSAIQARVVAAVIFTAIAANLLVQLFARRA
jgi:hypothetical protein